MVRGRASTASSHSVLDIYKGDNMRGLFILFALVFALVTGATANVVATTLQSQVTTSGDGR